MTTEHNAGPLHYPKALQLADALDNALVYGLRGREAAAELRRQHADIQQLNAQVFLQMKWKTEAQDENERLREALEGLVEAAEQAPGMGPCIALDLARAAIAKAEEVKP